jgi:hypothetical protein
MHERGILAALNLDPSKTRLFQNPLRTLLFSFCWSPSPQGFLKLNFDGASKGNPGEAYYGGLFRDENGLILRTYAGRMGLDNNNAELKVLEEGLQIAIRERYTQLVVEGDSQLIINMLSHLQHGSPLHKISKSWCLSLSLERISHLLNR